MNKEELENIINKNHLVEIEENCNAIVTDKNLMFKIEDGFLRPELAQGIFVNALRYSQQMRKELPFGLGQIGRSYRKEISPKPFLRMREFHQAEIEFFYDPINPVKEPKLNEHMDILLPVYTREQQELSEQNAFPKSVKYLSENNIINNEYLLYFMVKIYHFIRSIGIKKNAFRFRQHQTNEMAHYAHDCWDLECKIENSWVECIGCADRACFDLKSHVIQFSRTLKKPKIKKELRIIPNKKLIGKTFGEKTEDVLEHINSLSYDDISNINQGVKCDELFDIENIGKVTSNMITISEKDIKVHIEYFYPNVIEPSFGIDRILYAVYYNSFWTRESDGNRTVFSFLQKLSPYSVAVLQLSNNKQIMEKVNILSTELRKLGHKVYNDPSGGSIGRRYSRLDKIGIKYTFTVDFTSLEDNSVTIRERDTMEQKRLSEMIGSDAMTINHILYEMEQMRDPYEYDTDDDADDDANDDINSENSAKKN